VLFSISPIFHLPCFFLLTSPHDGFLDTADGSFVETSCGPAAHELKKRYDRFIKIDKDNRSPYAITAFVNQHGKQMYRVGYVRCSFIFTTILTACLRHRGQSAPAADAEQRTTMQLEQPPSSPDSRQGQARRRSHALTVRSERNASRKSRMSMHALLPGTMFPSVASRSGDATASTRSQPLRKLRRARSNPQISVDPLTLPPPPGRGHSQSVTAADIPRLPIYSTPTEPVPTLNAPILRDGFADVMRWDSESGPSSPISSYSHSHSHGSEFAPSIGPFNPFGSGVSFDSPALPKSPSDYLHVPLLREMQSFESGMTARADAPPRIASTSGLAPMSSLTTGDSSVADEAPFFPPGLDPLDNEDSGPLPLVSEEDAETARLSTCSSLTFFSLPRLKYSDPTYLPMEETTVHTRYSTEVFDVLQTYRGLPVLERLLEDPADTAVIKMTLTAEDSAAPRNDPRFVIWGTIALEPRPDESQTSRRSSGEFVHLRITTDGPERESVLVAATVERWLAQLTSALDYDELLVFFLTYRSYISALDLCHLLTCRFHWALGRSVSGGDEMVRRVVRVRTFVAIRYWLLTFFAVDFVPNRELRLLLASWLNTLRRDPILQKHTDATVRLHALFSVSTGPDDDCEEHRA
jgi:Gdp/GTP exchange factor required for growth at low temperatures